LIFQKSCCFANKAHWVVAFVVVEFYVGVALVVALETNEKLQQMDLQWKFMA
jgi:hypothetical protein